MMLEDSGQFEVVGQATSAQEAVRIALQNQPDVVILEVPAEETELTAVLQPILDCAPTGKIVIFASEEAHERGLEALRSGAAGFIGKDLDSAAFTRTLKGVLAGEAAISRRFATWLVARVREEPKRRVGMRPVRSRLTTREWEVLDLVTAGIPKAAIARDLSVTVGTVRSHLRNLARKLSLDARDVAGAGTSERPRPHVRD